MTPDSAARQPALLASLFQTSAPTSRAASVRASIAAAVIVVSALVMAGWVVEAPLMRYLAPALGTMLFNTALCLCLLAIGVLSLEHKDRAGIVIRGVLGGIVILLAGLTILDHWLAVSIPIHQSELHRWLQQTDSNAGRMPTGTSLALVLLGTALAAWPTTNDRREGAAVQVITLAAMLLAIFGILIRALQIDYLYSSYVLSAVPVHTAAGIILIAACYWIAWHREPWNVVLPFRSAVQRIFSFGSVVLVVIAIMSGTIALFVYDDALEETLTLNQARNTERADYDERRDLILRRQHGAASTRSAARTRRPCALRSETRWSQYVQDS